jgi:hypothetical protein
MTDPPRIAPHDSLAQITPMPIMGCPDWSALGGPDEQRRERVSSIDHPEAGPVEGQGTAVTQPGDDG